MVRTSVTHSTVPHVPLFFTYFLPSFLTGCQEYFNRNTLLNTPVDLIKQKQNKVLTFEFQNNSICNLNASYFHDYEGFQSNWQNVTDGSFVLKKRGTKFSVQVSC